MRTIALSLALLFVVAGYCADKPRIVFVAGEFEYKSKETLPVFARQLAKEFAVETSVIERPDDEKAQTISNLEALKDADLVVMMIRRMTPPPEQLEKFRKYLESGRPLVGLRTASHAFQNWKEFDAEVLGGNYQNHHGSKLKTTVSVIDAAREHPILRGVTPFVSDGSLYKNTPLRPGAKPLLMGKVEGQPAEPIAWTHEYRGARVFYTSLGHPSDFKEESFKNLVRNGIEWALGKRLERVATGN